MSGRTESQSNVVVYIGSRKLVALEGEISGEQARIKSYKVLKQPAGFEKGFVKSLGDAMQSLTTLLSRPTETAVTDQGVLGWIGMGQARQRYFSYESSKYYGSEPHALTGLDIRSVITQTRTVATLPLDQQILQTRPESFLVDDIRGVRNPLGLEARRVGVKLKLFTMTYGDYKNISKALEAADISPEGYVPKALALSASVLTEEEKNEGVILVDLSADHTLMVCWNEGQWIDQREEPVGTDSLTQALADSLQLDFKDADRIKEKYASLNPVSEISDELIPMVERDGKTLHQIKRHEFLKIFSESAASWLQDLTQRIQAFSKAVGCKHPCLVLTGGGAALDGLTEAVSREMPGVVRLGYLHKVEAPQELLVDLSMTSALATFRWLVTHFREDKLVARRAGAVGNLIERIRDWFVSYF